MIDEDKDSSEIIKVFKMIKNNCKIANANTAINTLNTELNNASTAISKKQDASTAITTSNISNQSVKYATNAGSAVDQTARNNANAALASSYASLSLTSTTIFTTLGNQVAFKIDNVVNIFLCFVVNSSVSTNGIICAIPSGYRPKWDIVNIAVPAYNSNGWITKGININTSGAVKSQQTLNTGDRLYINITYPYSS